MGTHRRRRARRGPSSDEDRISGLPDVLLHEILVRLRCARAAARTSVLSRRWRAVWAHLPELRLDTTRAAAASFMDNVDAALGGYLAPTLEHLDVSLSSEPRDRDIRVPAGRIAPWLRFAAEHVVGKLSLCLCVVQCVVLTREEVIELPVFERAKQIRFSLLYANAAWLRPQASGLFRALACLEILGKVCMEGSDLTALVSTQCPCLRDMNLSIQLIVNFDFSIRSNSLRTLVLRVINTRRLEIMAPQLEELTISDQPTESQISAPKLVKLVWHCAYDYDPHLHRFVNVGRTLLRLKTMYPRASNLIKRFNEVDALELQIDKSIRDVATCGSFLNERNILPKCKTFSISNLFKDHAFVPTMLHLLRSCNGTKKLHVEFYGVLPLPGVHSCLSSCPCRKIDGIDLSSLEVVDIYLSYSHEQMELVEFLSCNAVNLKRLLIDDGLCHNAKDSREKVRSIFHPNVKVEFYPLTKS